MHHWNMKNFDYQVIAGYYTQSDLVVGGAWSGDFKGLNFRGEFSLFQPLKNFTDTITTVAVSVGLDYVFANSLMLQTEILFNNVNSNAGSANLFGSLSSAPMSSKFLSICNWNIFAQASYPLMPRLNGSLSAMYFVDADAFYTGFSLVFSVIENLDLSVISQYFMQAKPQTSHALLAFLRLKYSF
jgi:hypothetical protein